MSRPAEIEMKITDAWLHGRGFMSIELKPRLTEWFPNQVERREPLTDAERIEGLMVIVGKLMDRVEELEAGK